MAAQIIALSAAAILAAAGCYGIVRLRRRLRELRTEPRERLPPAHPYRAGRPPEIIRRRAAHMAGHAALALLSPSVSTIEDADIITGRFRYHGTEMDTLFSKWELAVVCMGGLAGEYASDAPPRALFTYLRDVRHVRGLAEDAYGCHGRRSVSVRLEPYRETLESRRPRIGEEVLPEDLRDFVLAAYIEAKRRLRKHETIFTHIRQTLLIHGRVSARLLTQMQ